MEEFLKSLKTKNIHIVGVTGSEGSSILDFLLKNDITNITVHDFVDSSNINSSFITWHKGVVVKVRAKYLQTFTSSIEKVTCRWKENYLVGIEDADIVFVPQSWRLYSQNKPLLKIQKKDIPFYSLTRLYLDFANATVIGITGTVGKGSVAFGLVQFLEAAGRKVYFGGNDTWRMQVLSDLSSMTKEDFLVLEISHRQLQEGFTRAPTIAVLTNIFPNHQDEVSFENYKRLKYSLFAKQTTHDTAIIYYDNDDAREMAQNLKLKVLYYSSKNKSMNTKNIQSIYEYIMSIKSDQYTENLLAVGTIADVLGFESQFIKKHLPNILGLPARMQLIEEVNGVKFFDDIKSTTPWATLAALEKLGPNSFLICGGRTKGIDYKDFLLDLKHKAKSVIMLKSELSQVAGQILDTTSVTIVESLSEAVSRAYKRAKRGDTILLSPAAAFFYTDFVKGKESFRKLVTSLLQVVKE